MARIRRITNLFFRTKVEREIDAELRAHIEMRVEDNMARGMTAEEARRDALLRFGNPVVMKERVTGADAALGLENLGRDARYAMRQLRRTPNFTIAAILTLALGIGANSAIFSVINAVLLKPLSYPHPNRIVQFLLTFPDGPVPSASVPDFRLWREQARVFHDVSAYDFSGAAMSLTGDVPEQVRGVHVTANYFRLFGAPMLLGRTFTTEEDRPNGGKVVVLSYGLWKRKFGGDPNIVGKAISLGKEPYTVIGVTGQRFQPDPSGELWIPLQLDLNSSDQLHYLRVAGRLNPGLSLEQANAQLKLVANEARRSSPLADPEPGYTVEPLRSAMVGDVRSSLLLLGGAVSFVLLIACANVANLFLIRATGRKREFAIRAALGAGRRRILRQLLTESVLLSSAGGVLGLGLGLIAMRMLLAASPGDIPRIGENGAAVGLDWRVLAFTLSVSLLTGILFGLVPALRAARPDWNDALKEGGNQQGTGFRQNKARSLFVISEVALAVALLIGAALLIRTFVALRTVNAGFEAHNVLMMDMPLAKTHFAKTASVARLVRDARQQVNAIPGVQVSAATCCPPFADRMGLPFVIVGRQPGNSSNTGDGLWLDATPGYFDVFKIPILRGRDFSEQDDAGAPPVVLINEAMAKKYWPNQNPIGQ
jgi:predicted permease